MSATRMRRALLAGTLFLAASWGSFAATEETERLYLSGRGKDDAVPWKFMCTSGAQSGYWTNLPVPSNWELHGFGTLSYSRDAKNAWGETGLYARNFTVPRSWSSRRVFLVFEGVMTDTSASLNGEPVGAMHQGGFYRFKYEVTKLVRFGAVNHLDVTVAKHSANESVNNAERKGDYWEFGGIYRPVYLEAMPPRFIERVAVDARADGAFAMDVFVNGGTNGGTIEAQIKSLDGGAVGKKFSGTIVDTEATLTAQIASPRQWTAETPNLYLVEVRLKRGNRVLHRYRQRFGFRTMEVREGDGLYVNEHRVVLKGTNRHSFWPESGRCLSEAVHRLDIETMKDMNMNAVRMSHYPPDAEFLDLCDELGLYVLDELAGWHWAYNTNTGRKLVEEMVTRDVNHPCVLFWDNGDEGGGNTNLDNVFLQFDPQRRRVLHPWAAFNGLCTAHYLAYDKAQIACTGQAVYYHAGQELVATNDANKYIYMPTEFLHGLYDGGSGAGLKDYWEMMLRSKLLGGAFMWAFLDEGVKRPDTGEIDVCSNAAPDGIVGPYRQREGSFYAIKDIWSPIQVTRETNGSFTVENRYSFTDASQCKFTWQLRRFRDPNDRRAGHLVVSEWIGAAPSIPAGASGVLRLKLPRTRGTVDALALRVDDPGGRELWTWVWPLLRSSDSPALFDVPPPRGISVTTAETTNTLVAVAGDLRATFNKQSGFLDGVQRGRQKFSLGNGPRPAEGAAQLIRLDHAMEDGDSVIRATYSGDLKSVRWRVRSNGWVNCDYTYAADGAKDFFGVAFDYPESQVKGKKWLGDGPYRVWKNRLRGVMLNVWENKYNNTITGWRDWIYPEFKGCFANVRWLRLETTEGPITAVVGDEVPFTQVLTPEFPPADLVRKTAVSLPQAGLAFLHGIPPMGSKGKAPNTMGPEGQPNIANGEYHGSVNFYFGKPH
ncbi:MAG: glycoside hydrolase family 2 TIM barrel-domain containing protein [Verrucomicrobiia bacterium]